MKLETFFDFCSGIGGGRLGLERCGLRCVGSSDTSRLSNASYAQMHDCRHEKNIGNLKNVTKENLPDFDVLIAGFPCQTFSVIGRKAGFSDDRGQIIFHLARIIQETRPKAFILENVRGLCTHDGGKTIKIILNLLSECGYGVFHNVLSSIEYGVPQMRQRVYFIGFRDDLGINYSTFHWPEKKEVPHLSSYLVDENNPITEENYQRFYHYLKNPTNNGLYVPEDFLCEPYLIIDTRMSDLRLYRGRVPTLRSHRDGIFYVKNGELRQLTGYEALLLQGFPKEMADKVKSTVTDRHLLMQAGNAMTVNVIEALGKCVLNTKGIGEIMTSWEEFEENTTKYLQEHYTANFEKLGEHDSTLPDIKVTTSKGDVFFIEAKKSPAQSGQFVLLANSATNEFEYSPKNASKLNQHSEKIMNFMNVHFEQFKDAGTAGKDIALDESVFCDWIIHYYKDKSVKYFITSYNDEMIIVPVEKFAEYFSVSAKYRIKKSGSSAPSVKFTDEVQTLLDKSDVTAKVTHDGKKMFVETTENLNKKRFVGKENTFMMSVTDEGTVVRKLSNTANANVIFSIKSKKTQDSADLDRFKADL